ncbi:MAG: class I SAM-dependent methyltransferase [Mycobacteriales bacterium]
MSGVPTKTCRVCGSAELHQVLDLGEQALTGVFPALGDPDPSAGPLELGLCPDCGLVQLMHTYDAGEMYGENYGYRSGLNASMVKHLHRKARHLEGLAGLAVGDTVLDIGANDSTLLQGFRTPGLRRVGMDPTIVKWRQYYPDDITGIAEFFSADTFAAHDVPPARVVTSVAMFYDLDDPVEFARQVGRCLATDGVWHFEQSYMPSMLRATSYDTICHEHVEYYSLQVVDRILRDAGLELLDVRFNRVNGGSFAVTAQRVGGARPADRALIDWFLRQEARLQVTRPAAFEAFGASVRQHRDDLTDLVRTLRDSGASVVGYGASTKGNVLLQYCGLTAEDLPVIAEVNPEKFGCRTPGTNIPIASEDEVKADRPDYMLVLPWHFRETILEREAPYLESGGRLIFPLPEIEVIGD